MNTIRTILLSCFALCAMGGEVLNLDDGEKAGSWQARHDGKLALCDVRTTFNLAKVGDGSILTAYRKQKGGWCSLGRVINADWTTYACLRFWVRMDGVNDLEVRLTDTGNENFITKVTAKTPGEWEYVALPFASFERNKGYQAQGATSDGKLDLIKITDLSISPLGEGEGRFWLDQVDVAIIPEAQPLLPPATPPAPPARLFELDAPLVKKTTKVDVDAGRIAGRLSQHLAGGWGEDVGEFAGNAPWSDLVRAAGLPLLRINARLDRLTRDGVYDTWLLEQDIKALIAAGSQAYVVIDGTPAALGKSRENPTDGNAYADIAAAIVQRINIDQKLGVKYWQFWQDADVKTGWTGTAEEFGVLAARVIERMKRVDPSIVVFSGGLSRSTGVRAFGQQSVTLDPAVDGLAWSTFVFEKISEGNATEALERTWGFERTFLHVADLARAVGRPLVSSVAMRVANERTVYNPRLDSIFAPVYLASAINHLARQHAAVGLWQNATPQRVAGLIDAQGKHRPLVSFLGRWNAVVRERPWYWIESETGTAMVESLAAVSGDRFLILLVNKDSVGGQHDVTLKYIDMKIATANVWTLGRGIEAGEDKPLSGGGTRVILPPTSVTLISGTLSEPQPDPATEPEVAGGGGKTQVTVRHVDRATKTFFADDKDGRTFVVSFGDLKAVPGKKPAKDETPVEKAFLPGQQLEIIGRKKPPFIVAEKCVLQGETASVPTTSDSGFNLAERIKGKPVTQAERLKPGFDPARLAEMPGKPTLAFSAKQIQGIKGMPPQDSDFSAKVRLAWNEENLFVVAIIQDDIVMAGDPPTRWDRQDSVVIGFDMGIDSSAGNNDENDTQIVGYAKDKKGQAFTPVALGKKGGTFAGLKYSRPSNDAHTFIFTIPWTSLGFVPETGRRFGFNLVLTESDKEKSAEGFFEWAQGMSNVNLTAQDFSQFGILELK